MILACFRIKNIKVGGWPIHMNKISGMALFMAALTLITLAMVTYPWSSYSVEGSSITIHALAVSGQGQGAVVNITVTVLKGLPRYLGGNVYVSSMPLPTGESGTFISSSQIAAFVAATIASKPLFNYTFLINVNSSIIEIGGPSASGYMTAAMYALLTNRTLNQSVVMTGMIMPDGTIGPVGGIPDKVQAAAQLGFKTVLIPYGEQNYVTSSGQTVNVVELGKSLGVEVVPVATIYQVIQYFTGQEFNMSISMPSQVAMNITTLNKYLYQTLYVGYGNESRIGNPAYYNAALSNANNGNYYTAASLLYNALISYYTSALRNMSMLSIRGLVANISRTLNNMYNEVNQTPPTTANLDIIVGIYDRLYYAYSLLNSTMSDLSQGNTASLYSDLAQLYVRVNTLRYWFNVLRAVNGGYQIPPYLVAKLSGLYVFDANTVLTYLYSLANAEGYTSSRAFMSTFSQLLNLSSAAQEYYQSGRYLEALAISLDVIASASAYMHTMFLTGGANSTTYLLSLLRQVAMYNDAIVANCGGLPLLSSEYVEFGNYWFNQYNETQLSNPSSSSLLSYFTTALSMYEESIAYSLFLRQLYYELNLCGIENYQVNLKELNVTKPQPIPSQYTTQTITTTTVALTAPSTVQVNVEYMALGIALIALGIIILAIRYVEQVRHHR